MKFLKPITCAILIYTLIMPGTLFADVDWQARSTLKTSSKPIDVAVTADGKYTFILGENGKLFIYTAQGTLYDTIEVNPDMKKVDVDGTGNRVFLSNYKTSSVHELVIDYVAELDYTGSPFLGNAEAPVVLAVFSDFQ